MPNGKRSRTGRKSRSGKLRTRLTVFRYAERLFEAIDTPRSLACYLMLKHGEFKQLAEVSIDASDYLCSGDFFLDYQAISTLRKLETLPTGINRELAALRKFAEAEAACKETNKRLTSKSSRGSYPPTAAVAAVFHRAQQKISSVLGEVPSLSSLDFRFGPGAAFGVRGHTSAYNKMQSQLECCVAMLPILGDFMTELPVWSSDERRPVRLTEGSELTFVPKDAKIDRPICIEPLLNGLYQKGFGSYVRSRLGRWGVNLNDQGINQKLASRAHVEQLATIDFSSASDTIAYGLVLDLLPFDWFEALDVARCPGYRLGKRGKWREFHKFSSMGNAYTFELESLLFFALASASCEVAGIPYTVGTNFHVYGDDVIIPRDAFGLFHQACNYAGFSINDSKSYISGQFFESCGHDYYQGSLVRPFFIKKDVKQVEDANYLANKTLEFHGRLLECNFKGARSEIRKVSQSLEDLHSWVIGSIPRRLRLPGPLGSGDGVLYCDFDVAVPTRPRGNKRGWDGYCYVHVARSPVRIPYDEVRLSYVLYLTLGCGKGQGSDRGAWDPRWLPNVLSLSGVPVEDDNSTGYVVRNRTKFSLKPSIWFGQWPLLPVRWSEKAIALLAQRGK